MRGSVTVCMAGVEAAGGCGSLCSRRHKGLRFATELTFLLLLLLLLTFESLEHEAALSGKFDWRVFFAWSSRRA